MLDAWLLHRTFIVKSHKRRPFSMPVTIRPATPADAEALLASGLVKKQLDGIKVLGFGELTKKFTVKANAFSAEAKAKIEAAGGTAEIVG